MASSALDLCSKALLKTGANTISSFEEGTTEAEVAAAFHPLVRDSLLATHPWNFAIRSMELALILNVQTTEYENAFQLPADCIRVLSAGIGKQESVIEYSIRGHYILTDSHKVTLTYVYRVDESYFPAFFVNALVSHLASEFCIPLTDSTSRWDSLRRAADIELRKAKFIDELEDTPARLKHWTLIEERY